MKILVAEDEQRAREGLAELIRSLGDEYEIVGLAANGRTALDLIRSEKPNLVFADIKMPYLSGLDLIKEARTEQYQGRFVLVSAYAEFEYAKEAMQMGCDDYILKPPMKDELLKVLVNAEHILKYGSRSKPRECSLADSYPAANPLVKSTLSMIESGYKANLSQQQIAQQLGVSPEYLSYLFARDVQVTFARFVRDYRIRKAKELLRDRSVDVHDVPFEVGFTDRKYFNKVFHEVTGESVTDFLGHVNG